ncbi:AraC family transcriptional regulator [Flavobacterium sp. F-65]|uniref:AraC family transcriptional regulator n=1 Tax=Flavobacterium pisciphilum TaxID=2893755 RepID=A0ABS8MNQ9_9FLAO|nr:AraC family transcriptional regulator [Flavobacterium sp. F-65]MCC9070399.1 AraC family transcriptional regulator [Flavobacterium sp. F-65]
MDLKLFVPQSKLLKNYIDYFYILKKSPDSENISYFTFPYVNTIVSINQYPEFIFEENRLTVKKNTNNPILATLLCGYTKPIEVNIPDYIHEITISFKPLGVNAFLENNLNFYNDKSFTYFNPFSDFTASMTEIMNTALGEEKIKKLEQYLISKFNGFSHPFLGSILTDMQHTEGNYTIKDLADKYKISRKTLCKHFEIHIGKTPSELRKIIRFRQTMHQQMNISTKNNLSDVTYQLDFFDQSHLIKDFKSITGFTPKNFFKKITSHEDGNINWLYI